MSQQIIIHEFNEKTMLNNCLNYSENNIPILWNACQTKGSNSINRGYCEQNEQWIVNKMDNNNKSKSRNEKNSIEDMD